MPSEVLSFVGLQAALDRCMAAHPVDGREHRMHADANAMADLWAPMALQSCQSVNLEKVDDHVFQVYLRWRRSEADTDSSANSH